VNGFSFFQRKSFRLRHERDPFLKQPPSSQCVGSFATENPFQSSIPPPSVINCGGAFDFLLCELGALPTYANLWVLGAMPPQPAPRFRMGLGWTISLYARPHIFRNKMQCMDPQHKTIPRKHDASNAMLRNRVAETVKPSPGAKGEGGGESLGGGSDVKEG
jgi:hypothetical protein